MLPASTTTVQGGRSKGGEWQYRFKRGWKVLGRCTQGRVTAGAHEAGGGGGDRPLDAAFSVGDRVVSEQLDGLGWGASTVTSLGCFDICSSLQR